MKQTTCHPRTNAVSGNSACVPLHPFVDSIPFASEDANANGLSFTAAWAKSADDIREAQRLRYRVFAGEMGATLTPCGHVRHGLDIDEFDPFCAHLLVRARDGLGKSPVIATCRILTPEGARRAGGRYFEDEFDARGIQHLLSDALEMGRVCVDPAWRNGLVVMAIWQQLGGQMARRQLRHLVGCTSISLADGGRLASSLWGRLQQSVLVSDELRVTPWNAYAVDPDNSTLELPVPALLKGYLRCGGKLLGQPAHDRKFNTADFPMMMRLEDLPARYNRRIFKG
jgi:putative hemolysin